MGLCRADYVETVLTSSKILKKAPQYDFLHNWLGTGLLTSTGSKWKTRRRLLTPAFHFRILEDFTSTMSVQSIILAEILGKESRRYNGIDVVPKVTMCTLDIICETIMGTQINAQIDASSSYVNAVNRLGELFLRRLSKPLLWVDFIFRASYLGTEYYRCLDTLHSFTRKVIADRKLKLKEEIDAGVLSTSETGEMKTRSNIRRPFLDLMLMEHLKNSGAITDEGIREEVDTLMFAGHDTTAMGISWALFLIGHSPKEQEKIHDELDFIFGDDRERHVTEDDLKEMKYLECAIKESHRIYPPVPFISRTCEEPFELAGVMLQKGTIVQISNYSLNRNSDVFPKPEEFHPERFLPENSRGRNPFAYLPFSAGPRNCVGQKFAMSEEKTVIANILRRYQLKSVQQRDVIVLVSQIVLRPRDGLRIKFIPRLTKRRLSKQE